MNFIEGTGHTIDFLVSVSDVMNVAIAFAKRSTGSFSLDSYVKCSP